MKTTLDYSKNKKIIAELNDLKRVQFHQKGSLCQVGAFESLIAKKSTMKKEPSTLYQDKRKGVLRVSQESSRPQSSLSQEY